MSLMITSRWLSSDSFSSWWAATIAAYAYCSGRMAEHLKSDSARVIATEMGHPVVLGKNCTADCAPNWKGNACSVMQGKIHSLTLVRLEWKISLVEREGGRAQTEELMCASLRGNKGWLVNMPHVWKQRDNHIFGRGITSVRQPGWRLAEEHWCRLLSSWFFSKFHMVQKRQSKCCTLIKQAAPWAMAPKTNSLVKCSVNSSMGGM